MNKKDMESKNNILFEYMELTAKFRNEQSFSKKRELAKKIKELENRKEDEEGSLKVV